MKGVIFIGTKVCSYYEFNNNLSSLSDVCYLRLDFEQFSTLGPSTNVDEAVSLGGSCAEDSLKFTVCYRSQVCNVYQGFR